MSVLSIKDLSVSIGATGILHAVSFDLNAGDILAVTGESGSGKSMTALTAMQLLPKSAHATGQVLFDGRDLLQLPEAEMCALRGRDIGMVFQEPMTALNPVQTIGAQVMETILIHDAMGRADAEARAREVLARVGLPPDKFPLSRYPHELSGGQRQRVVIAMAIALRPRLLIADEPTTALDVTTQAQILDLLQGLVAEHHMAMLMITHDLAVVAQMADQICVMQHGRIVEAGPAQTVLREQNHPYTRMLFEASQHQVALPDMPDAQTLLEVRSVVREYALPRRSLFDTPGVFRAVDRVSFSIAKGERVGLVGESGCGKSTLTRAILGLEPVQDGQILLNGGAESLGGANIQVVFQDPYGSFNPRHTVQRLITEPFHGVEDAPHGAARRKLVEETLEAVGLTAQDADKYPHQFSGGQRQRIAIARALITRPDLILFDEAVSALDVSVRAQVLDLIAALCEAYGLTYLFISHDLSVVRSVTDRVLVMQAGKIVEEGRTETVFADPQHAYTRHLINAAPVLPDFGGEGQYDANRVV